MKILVAPLDWGLGHATRCIPIIDELTRQGNEVFIAAEKNTEHLLKKEFPDLNFIRLHGYRVRYSSLLPMSFTVLLQTPKILYRIVAEHRALKKIINEHQLDAVISDNRYGLWNKKIPSVFITHQVMIKCPLWLRFLEPLLYHRHSSFIKKFNDCWIPDDERKLSGDLSHSGPLPSNANYIGSLSRWKKKVPGPLKKKYDVIGIVSGPEPHRTTFEKELIRQIGHSNLNGLVVCGKPGEKSETLINGNLRIVNHLESKELCEAILSAGFVLARAGYSSIMDLAAIRKDAVLIPTPGQTEQIYLAGMFSEKKIFFSMAQKHFNLEKAMIESKKYSINFSGEENDPLKEIISSWLKKISAPSQSVPKK